MLSLVNALAETRAERFVLVSTVDVYPVPVGVDESTPFEPAHPRAYGEHRLEFERIVADRFPDCRIVRLPTVFGTDMPRNPLADLIRRRDLDGVDPPISHLVGKVAQLARHRAITRRLAPALVRGTAARAVYRVYPRRPNEAALRRWARAERVLLGA